MSNLDRLEKDYQRLFSQRSQLKSDLDRAEVDTQEKRAAMSAAVLEGKDPEKLADQVRRLELKAEAIRGALGLLDGQIKSKAGELDQAQRSQAVDQLAMIDTQAAESFDRVLDCVFATAAALDDFDRVVSDGYRVMSQYDLPRGAGLRLAALSQSFLDHLADSVKIVKQTHPELLQGRPSVDRRTIGNIVPMEKPDHQVGVSPISWLLPPKPGQLR